MESTNNKDISSHEKLAINISEAEYKQTPPESECQIPIHDSEAMMQIQSENEKLKRYLAELTTKFKDIDSMRIDNEILKQDLAESLVKFKEMESTLKADAEHWKQNYIAIVNLARK